MILNGRLTIVITIGSVLRESFGVPLVLWIRRVRMQGYWFTIPFN